MKRTDAWLALVAATLTATICRGPAARAQAVDPPQPRTIAVGLPPGARADRVDAARTGFARSGLPASSLRVEWRAMAGGPLENAPLVDARGRTYLVGARGEAVALGPDGNELWRVPTGSVDPGPGALLSDDTLVFVDGAGLAVAVRDGAVRWRTRIGKADSEHPAPLPLDDGGVVVATSRQLSLLDGEGHERARVPLPEPTSAALLSVLGRVAVLATTGTVWTWTPGAPDLERAASFGSPTDGGAALSGPHTLVAVTAGRSTLASLDLLRGTPITRAIAPGGLWIGPPAMRGEIATLPLLGATSEFALALDASGRELARARLASLPPSARPDAGAPGVALEPIPLPPLLVDAEGTVAFATPSGGLGVAALVSGEGAVETLADVCPRPSALVSLPGEAPPVAGLAPLAHRALVVACRTGAVLAVTGS
jgi:hypothetical protein